MKALFTRAWIRPGIAALLIIIAKIAGWASAGLLSDIAMIAAAVVAGTPIVISALRALRARTIGIDLLVSIATIGALIIGEYWEAAAVTTLFAIGHALEAGTLSRTRRALSDLVSTAPETAVVLRDGEPVEVDAVEVQPGEHVLVRSGTRVPVDGEVLEGRGAVDEASITGESVPAEKAQGDPVYAGTVSASGLLTVRADGIGADTTLARIIRRVEEAQDAKAPTQAFMDRFSRWYTPAIIVAAIVFGLITRDIELALTLLVISCPGALVISIPVAIVAGIGRGATQGMLIKGGEHLENSATVDAVALDKTGTLTLGKPRLTDIAPLGGAAADADDELLTWAARAERTSDHPLAAPIVRAAQERGLDLGAVPETADVLAGRGVRAVWNGHVISVGNEAMLHEDVAEHSERPAAPVGPAPAPVGPAPAPGTGVLTREQAPTRTLVQQAIDTADRLAAQGRTPMIVTVDGRPLGVIGVADEVRSDARDAIAALRHAGVREIVMLTGDQEAAARAIASEVGIDEVRARLLPEDKLDAIQELQQRGRTVAMVGDGVNDAPALATADVGVSMGAAGSAVAIETSDIALMRDSLPALAGALSLARKTIAVMRQNIAIALITVAALVAGVIAGGVTMSLGMLVHELSVLVVILNAMRLLRHRV